jgi:hypothetical protein
MFEFAQLDPSVYNSSTPLWAAFRDSAGNVWNGTTYVAYSTSAIVLGAVEGVPQGNSGFFSFAVPIEAGKQLTAYTWTLYRQIGGSPASSDLVIESANVWPFTIFAGPGDPCTITVTDQIDGHVIAGAAVWITDDAAGLLLRQGQATTSSDGKVTFRLVDGTTYYLWAEKPGENPINGLAFVAVKD